MHFSTYGFLFNYVLLVLYLFSCLFVVSQAELFVVFSPGFFWWGYGYLPSATDRIIVHLSAFLFWLRYGERARTGVLLSFA